MSENFVPQYNVFWSKPPSIPSLQTLLYFTTAFPTQFHAHLFGVFLINRVNLELPHARGLGGGWERGSHPQKHGEPLRDFGRSSNLKFYLDIWDRVSFLNHELIDSTLLPSQWDLGISLPLRVTNCSIFYGVLGLKTQDFTLRQLSSLLPELPPPSPSSSWLTYLEPF